MSCGQPAARLVGMFPASEHPYTVCSGCPSLRVSSDGTQFHCHAVDAKFGRLANPALAKSVKKVVLRDRLVVDGHELPPGSVVNVVGPGVSGLGWWIRVKPPGRTASSTVYVKNESAEPSS